MMHAREKSDSAIVAGKPTNKAERSATKPAEPRAETKGNANQQSTRRMRESRSYGSGRGSLRDERVLPQNYCLKPGAISFTPHARRVLLQPIVRAVNVAHRLDNCA